MGSHLGGGPFHLWSTSHMSSFRPTRTYPGLQWYLIILLNWRVPLMNSSLPFTISAGIPHSKSESENEFINSHQIMRPFSRWLTSTNRWKLRVESSGKTVPSCRPNQKMTLVTNILNSGTNIEVVGDQGAVWRLLWFAACCGSWNKTSYWMSVLIEILWRASMADYTHGAGKCSSTLAGSWCPTKAIPLSHQILRNRRPHQEDSRMKL